MRSLTKRSKPVVAHVHTTFFVRSETFIYQYISCHKRFRPIDAASAFENLDQFPLPRKDRFALQPTRPSLGWLLEKLHGPDIHLERAVNKSKARLMHAHFGTSGMSALPAATHTKIPLVTTFYGFDITRQAKEESWMSRYRQLFQHGRLFLVEGPHMKSHLAGLGCPEAKIRVQRIAISTNTIVCRPRTAKSSGDSVVFIFSGRFVEKKGLLYALRAFRQLRCKYNNFEFRIIGDGPLRQEIQDFVVINQMTDYVKLLGFLSYKDYLTQMSLADVFVHPSVTAADGDSEGGAPTTILEAQAMGMPVVSTLHADIPNVVAAGASALLCRERNVAELSDNLTYMMENQNSWKDMGIAGREFVQTHHDVSKEIDKLEDKYDALL
jgi:colanic acid/amylovoran biosynthesis glycosyltransferase